MSERIVVIGAGMAGLWSAIALARSDREIIVLDRDAGPPEDAEEAFSDWQRRGVGQLRHSHAFLARLRTLARDEHPELYAQLLAAGCRELGFEGGLTAQHKAKGYTPQPIDADLAVLTSRRTTLEWVMRRYAEGLPGVSFRPATFVKSLELAPGRPLTVKGVRLEDDSVLTADSVVDAAGRNSTVWEELTAAGAKIPESSEPCGIIYFTRHYRLLPGQEEPQRGRHPGTGDLGYMKFGVFPGDNGCFSITLCAPEVEEELRKALMNPETFDAVCRELPGLASWVAPDRAEPTTKVYGMGQLESRWRDYAPDGRPAVLRLYPVGDTVVRTNPLYGRGCSFAAVSAHLLRDVFAASADPAQRLIAYRAGLERELRPYDKVMRQADRQAIRRAKAALGPERKPALPAKLARSFLIDGVGPAMREDVELLRAFMRGFHMLEHPDAWLRRPANIAKITKVWARGKERNAELYPPKPGPDRDDMLTAVGVCPKADRERAA